jgi:hypothetical protein
MAVGAFFTKYARFLAAIYIPDLSRSDPPAGRMISVKPTRFMGCSSREPFSR